MNHSRKGNRLMYADMQTIDGTLVSHNVWVSGHRTSVRLEPVMWDAINDIAELEAMTLHELVSTVADRRSPGASLTASLRAFIVAYLRAVSSKDQLRGSRAAAATPVREVAALRA